MWNYLQFKKLNFGGRVLGGFFSQNLKSPMMIVKYNRDRHSTVNNTGRMWGMTIVDGSEIGISVKCSFYFKDKISKVFSHGLYGLSS